MTAFPIISAATLPKMDLFSNMLHDNGQSANMHALLPSFSPKSVFDNEIHFGKADFSTPCMILKPAFVQEIDDNDNNTNFKFASRVYVVRRKIGRLLGEQRLSKAKS